MREQDIGRWRLVNQQIARPRFTEPGQVVRWLGAMQAQDYLGALWGVGLRVRGATERDVEHALADRSIVRTWPMRGTLHFVAAEDVRWMLKLLTPRIIAGRAARHRQLELDDETLARSGDVVAEALHGGRQLTRPETFIQLQNAGISTAGQRGIHIVGALAQDGLICFGPRAGKQQTFVLLDEWIPRRRDLEREEALAELARRYFTGHGPATLRDLVWWSGLKVSDAKAGVEMVASELETQTINGAVYHGVDRGGVSELPEPDDAGRAVHMLPGFDELLLGYRDRSAVLDPMHAQKIQPGSNGIFSPTVVVNGRVVGTWKRTFRKAAAVIEVNPFGAPSTGEERGIVDAAQRYGRFLGMTVQIVGEGQTPSEMAPAIPLPRRRTPR